MPRRYTDRLRAHHSRNGKAVWNKPCVEASACKLYKTWTYRFESGSGSNINGGRSSVVEQRICVACFKGYLSNLTAFGAVCRRFESYRPP